MIPVEKQKEPQAFNNDVRVPGQKYLQQNPRPNSREFEKHDYWRKISPELYQLYSGICAYTGMWFANTLRSIDHFIPKSKSPVLAYEWDNYRLTTKKMNNAKGDEIDLLDPFNIKFDRFILDLSTCIIKPNKTLSAFERERIAYTIKVLKLNCDDERVESRREIIQGYIDGVFNFKFLKEKYPYIAYEIERQRPNKV